MSTAPDVSRDQARSALLDFLATIARPGSSPHSVDDDDNLIDVGVIDSLAMLHIIMYLEQEYGVDLASRGIDPGVLVSVSGILDCVSEP